MKKLNLVLLFAVVFMGNLFAQPVITYSTHALKIDSDNPMYICKYANPGTFGPNQTWDFSDLELTNDFTGHVNRMNQNTNFSDANLELEEFGVSFFFDSNKDRLDQVGYSSSNGRTKIHYSQPFRKMNYPFRFEDLYTGNFSGEYSFDNKKLADISGIGEIEADSWGTLILPNNSVYENTIRVKTIKSYTMDYGTSSSDVEIVTYRWYNDAHRYPLLVQTSITTINGDNEHTSYKAAYNNNAVSYVADVDNHFVNSLELYPNPSNGELTISVEAEKDTDVQISIIDITGKSVYSQAYKHVKVGTNQIDFSEQVSNLRPANYIVQIKCDEQVVSKELIVTQ